MCILAYTHAQSKFFSFALYTRVFHSQIQVLCRVLIVQTESVRTKDQKYKDYLLRKLGISCKLLSSSAIAIITASLNKVNLRVFFLPLVVISLGVHIYHQPWLQVVQLQTLLEPTAYCAVFVHRYHHHKHF